ncbi:hypothetical protein KCW65_29055, partial [Mycobacterium tuberculosis]|nr:hypothetical protein [Mycobacterium tuberculosis]
MHLAEAVAGRARMCGSAGGHRLLPTGSEAARRIDPGRGRSALGGGITGLREHGVHGRVEGSD